MQPRFPIALIVCAVLTAGASAVLAQWKGEIATRDGVTHVVNPESPVEEISVTLKELWRVGGDDEEVLFGVISQLLHDESGNVYALDSQLSEVHVYSPSGEHLRTIGREGEGPGEFRNGSDMYLGPGGVLGVVQVFPGKIVLLQRDGTPAGNFPLPAAEGGGFQLVFVGRGLADRVVLAGAQTKTLEGSKQMQVSYLKAFDAAGKEKATYHTEEAETQFGGMKFFEKTFSNFQRRWALAPDARVAAALDFDAYTIHVWKGDGTLDRVIERPGYALVPRDAAAKKRMQRLYDGITRWNPGSTFEISQTHGTVSSIAFRDDGSLWIMSSAGAYKRGDGVFATFDVYDAEGRFTTRVHLRGDGDPTEDGIFFVGDRLYVVTDLFGAFLANFATTEEGEVTEEAEPVSVIAYQLDLPAVAPKK
jgi:hypothetical protein